MTMIRLGESDTSLENDAEDDRRNESDRRQVLGPTNFPVYTACGNWVRRDRRNIPERRLQSIDVAEDQILEEEFKDLFKDFA